MAEGSYPIQSGQPNPLPHAEDNKDALERIWDTYVAPCKHVLGRDDQPQDLEVWIKNVHELSQRVEEHNHHLTNTVQLMWLSLWEKVFNTTMCADILSTRKNLFNEMQSWPGTKVEPDEDPGEEWTRLSCDTPDGLTAEVNSADSVVSSPLACGERDQTMQQLKQTYDTGRQTDNQTGFELDHPDASHHSGTVTGETLTKLKTRSKSARSDFHPNRNARYMRWALMKSLEENKAHIALQYADLYLGSAGSLHEKLDAFQLKSHVLWLLGESENGVKTALLCIFLCLRSKNPSRDTIGIASSAAFLVGSCAETQMIFDIAEDWYTEASRMMKFIFSENHSSTITFMYCAYRSALKRKNLLDFFNAAEYEVSDVKYYIQKLNQLLKKGNQKEFEGRGHSALLYIKTAIAVLELKLKL